MHTLGTFCTYHHQHETSISGVCRGDQGSERRRLSDGLWRRRLIGQRRSVKEWSNEKCQLECWRGLNCELVDDKLNYIDLVHQILFSDSGTDAHFNCSLCKRSFLFSHFKAIKWVTLNLISKGYLISSPRNRPSLFPGVQCFEIMPRQYLLSLLPYWLSFPDHTEYKRPLGLDHDAMQ